MPTLRQEINLLTGSYSGTGTVSSNEIAQLDTTRYSGTCTFYFEAVFSGAASNTGNIRLTRSGTTTDDATISGATSATVGIGRSASFTPPAGATSYIVRLVGDGTRSQTVKAARIIVIQSEGTITKTRTVIELGNTQAFTATALTALTNPKYFKFTAANWSGLIVASFQICCKTSTASATGTAELQVSDGTGDGFVNWASNSFSGTAADADVTTTSSTATLVSLANTTGTKCVVLKDGRNYRFAFKTSSSKSAFTIYSAKLIIDSYNNVSNDFESGARSPPWINDGGTPNYNYVATPLSGSVSLRQPTGSASAIVLSKDIPEVRFSFLVKMETITSLTTIVLVSNAGTDTNNTFPADVLASVKVQANGTVTVCCDGNTGPTATTVGTMSAGTIYNVFVYFKFVTNGTSLASVGFTTDTTTAIPVSSGNNFASLSNGTAAFPARQFDLCAVVGSDSAVFDNFALFLNPLNGLETQYLLSNSILAAGTALQSFFTKWDPTEWAGSTVSFKHAADAANGSTSVIELDTDSGTQITGSVVTSPDNEGFSSALTMPDAANLDVKATTNNSDVYGSKMLAIVDLSPKPPMWQGQIGQPPPTSFTQIVSV